MISSQSWRVPRRLHRNGGLDRSHEGVSMPTYEYACSKCGEHVEVVQSFRDEPLRKCPACGGKLKKVFGAVGIVFKGSGFYKTDSRSSQKTPASASSDKSVSSEKTPSTSSDTSSSGTDSASTKAGGDTKASKKTDTSGSKAAAAS
jgi:putative FmdB family regulatory protein